MKIQVHINKTSVSIKDRGFNYGDGLFETILVKNNKALYLSDHIKRLTKGCKVLKIPTPNLKLVENSIKQSISRTKECIIKIIYTRGLSDHGYGYDKNIIPQLYVIKKRKSHSKIKNTISLGYSKYFLNDNSSLSKIKHMNRLEQILGTTFKPKKIYDNYILVDKKNHIIECISSNIFFYKYNHNKFIFHTPSLKNNGVEGILKQQIIKAIAKRNISVLEKNIKKDEITKYHGAFICNSISGIEFVGQINEVSLNHIECLEDLLHKYIYE